MSGTSARLTLSPDRCEGCGKCVRVCPSASIRVGGGYVYLDSSACTGCMRCADVCERGAIARREAPVRPTATKVATVGASPKVVVGSRAEAKALRTMAEQAERDRVATEKAAARQSKRDTALQSHARMVADDGTAAWSLVDAAVALGILAVGVVAKELMLRSGMVAVMPASGQVLARTLVLGGFYTIQMFALVFLAHRHGRSVSAAFGLARLKRSLAQRAASVALVLGLLLATRAAALLWGVVSRAAGWGPPVSEQLVDVFGTGGAGLALAVVTVVVVGPFVEELVFRGVVLGAAGPRWGMWPAILVAAALFAAAHLTAWAFVPTFVLGVALGWLAWTRGSLWPAIALHALYNGVVVAAAFWLAR